MNKENIDIKIKVQVNDENFIFDKKINVLQYKDLVCPDLLIEEIIEKIKKELTIKINDIIK